MCVYILDSTSRCSRNLRLYAAIAVSRSLSAGRLDGAVLVLAGVDICMG